ncbi:MAG TPA: hypothetical protein VIV40_09765 [Kofleriaceae bacterium]
MNSRLDIDRALDRGAFLARLYALFGAPAARAGGFEYYVRDTETGLDFIAYAGARGPCYGGAIEDRQALRRVVEALEDLLEQTQPVQCAIEYTADLEYGGGTWILGYNEGRSFDLPDRRERRPPTAVERRAR